MGSHSHSTEPVPALPEPNKSRFFEAIGRVIAQMGGEVKIPAASSGAFRRKLSVMLGESVPQTP